jgi:hypothetical protein
VRGILEGATNAQQAGVALTVTIGLLVLAFMLWLVFMIGRRRNWARITFLVLFLLGFIPAVPALIGAFDISVVSGLLGVSQVVFQVAALVLLFVKDSSEWFRQQAATVSA